MIMHLFEMGFKIKVLERAKCMRGNMREEGGEKKSIKESKKRIRKNMAKRENEKNIYRNGGLDCCHPVRVSASAI